MVRISEAFFKGNWTGELYEVHGFFDARYLPHVGYGAKAYVIETPRGKELATNASPISGNSIVPHHPVMSVEYDALLALLHHIKNEFPDRSALVMGDNRGVVHQLVDGAKQKGLQEKQKQALRLLDALKVDVKWVPRTLNKKADSLTNKVDIGKLKPTRMPVNDAEEAIPDMPEEMGNSGLIRYVGQYVLGKNMCRNVPGKYVVTHLHLQQHL